MATKFIFFDIGDVIFDENAQHQWLFHQLLLTLRAHGKDVLWDDFNATRKRLAAEGPNPEAAINRCGSRAPSASFSTASRLL